MMASFGGKNPPWARAASATQQVAQVAAQGQVLGQPAVFTIASSQPAVAPQYTAGQVAVNPLAQVPGLAIPTTLGTTPQVGTVSYPTPRPVAPGAPQAAAGTQKQRVFTGTVTKLHDNFGFVDDDVFFQISRVVKGQQPRVGDRVLVEASYNSNMPFKWNASRIQVMPSGGATVGAAQPQAQPQTVAYGKQTFGQGGITPANVPPPSITPSMLTGPPPNVHPPPLMGNAPVGGAGQQGSRFGGGRNDSGRDSNRDRRDRRDRDRRSPIRRQRSPAPPRRRSRSKERKSSPRRSRSPIRKKPALVIRRYNVQVPKINLDMKEASVTTLKARYSNMYVPSDFFSAAFQWTEAFPLHRPFNIGHYCSFHVMHKEVEPLNSLETVLEPSDADHLFSAKVMLLSCPILEDLYHKACALAEDPQDVQEGFQHPTRLIQFLVGMKGKSEPMAIGGPWSPSLDGKNPDQDPRVLINTAIRTTRALTGIDLSGCTQWYRFAEIRYHRPEETHKGRTLPARVETVVIFLPDVWSCQPSQIEWETLQFGYKKLLSTKLSADKDESQEEEMETGDTPTKADPTHYSELDPKNMKVSDLRQELEARSISSKGLKSQLIARLTKATKSEQEKEEQSEAEKKEAEAEEENKEDDEAKREKEEAERLAKEEEERKKKEERDRAIMERHYTLPPNPAIMVHPSTTAKSGKFDCTVMNLSVLLDYRPEDTKEHSFEVSLFAELFNEMLMRDFGFQIYKALVFAPEKKEEPRSSKDKDKDKDKDDKEGKKDDKKDDSDEPAAKKQKTDEKTDKSKKEEKKDGDRGKEERSSSKDKEDDDKKKDKDKDKKRDRDERRKEKIKQFTADPALLLAFVYFDQNHTGYLLDKDCEEIIHTLGLHLTRSQVKKLVQKLVSRDTLSYRKLTDKPQPAKEGEESDKKDAKKDEGKGKKEEAKAAKAAEEAKEQPVPDEKLAEGNKHLLPSQPEETGGKRTTRKKDSKEEDVDATGLIRYKGAMIDVNNIMAKVQSSEKTRTQLEVKIKELQEELDELRKSFNSSEASGQRQTAELGRLQKKLQEQSEKRSTAEKHAEEMLRAVLAAKGQLDMASETLGAAVPKPKVEPKEGKEEEKKEETTSVKEEPVKTEPMQNGEN